MADTRSEGRICHEVIVKPWTISADEVTAQSVYSLISLTPWWCATGVNSEDVVVGNVLRERELAVSGS